MIDPPERPTTLAIAVLSDAGQGEENASRSLDLAAAIIDAPDADLLVLPYLGPHPPFWERIDRSAAFRHVERPPSPSMETVHAAAHERGIALLASAYEALGEGVFYALADMRRPEGDDSRRYRQWHAVNLPGLHERLYFQPGSGMEPPLFRCGDLHLGVMLGGDLWAPEMARLLRLAGAELLLAVTALPESQTSSGVALARARSIENGVPVLLANRGDAPLLFADGERADDPRDGGRWSIVAIIPETIRGRLRRDDPLAIRRPRLYGPLARRWEEPTP